MDITTIREKARRDLHVMMGRPAVYYANPDDPEDTGLDVAVRLTLKPSQTGDLAGTNLSYVETTDFQEKVKFWREEVESPAYNGLLILSPTEGYFIDAVDPPYGQTVTTEIVRTENTTLSGKRAPGVDVI